MIKYDDFLILNEAKIDNYKEGDYFVCSRDFRGITGAAEKLVQMEKLTDVGGDIFFTLKIQRPEGVDDRNEWMYRVYVAIGRDHGYKDVFAISKSQGRSLIPLTNEDAKEYLKGNIVKFECTKIFEDILKELKLKSTKKFIDVAYIHVDKDKNDMVSFVPMAKYKSEIKDKRIAPERAYDLPFRQTMKVGKFFRKLKPELTDAQVEDLVNRYKYIYDKVVKKDAEEVEVVTGEDIRKWYHGKNYGTDKNGYQRDLGNSCMRYPHSQHRFDIYCENPDKIGMAIIKNDKGLLIARALIWKLDDGSVYMDRIYAVDVVTEQKMREYCKKNNMVGPWVRDMCGVKRVTLKRDYGDASHNPFMDTFKYFNRETFTLLTVDACVIDGKKKAFSKYYYTDND